MNNEVKESLLVLTGFALGFLTGFISVVVFYRSIFL